MTNPSGGPAELLRDFEIDELAAMAGAGRRWGSSIPTEGMKMLDYACEGLANILDVSFYDTPWSTVVGMSAVAEQAAREAVSDYQGNADDDALEDLIEDLAPDYDLLGEIAVEPAATPAERNAATLVVMLRRMCLALVHHLADEGTPEEMCGE